jgi:hypothetical protein
VLYERPKSAGLDAAFGATPSIESMEPLAFAQRVLSWRWTPCVAPVMGSVFIALLTLAVVPDEIGGTGAPSGALALRSKNAAASSTASEDPESDGAASGPTTPARRGGVGNARSRVPSDTAQGMFQNAQELPSEPVDPAQPPPPQPPVALPANGFTLPPEPAIQPPLPPPVAGEPGTLPPPDVPLQPLGPTGAPSPP